MVRFLHIADAHLGFEQYGKFRRFRDFGRVFRKAIEFGVEEKVDFIIIAGDLFNKRSINATTLLQADESLSIAKEAGIPVVVCEGNHDSPPYGDNWSWLGYLSRKGHIILLGPEDKTGNLVQWNPEKKEGTYFEHEFRGERIRIYGFGYLGAATKNAIMRYSDDIIRDDSLNIGILHYGVEGIISNMHGTISESALRPFKGKIHYLALGHIHKHFEIENWAYNPGSLENWNLDETNYPHGLYLVEMERDGNGGVDTHPRFVDSKEWRRPFLVWKVDLTGVRSPEQVLERVKGFLRGKGYPLSPDSMPVAGDEQTSAPPAFPGSPTPAGFGTLDAYMRKEKKPAITEEKNEESASNGCRFDEEPVVIVRLRGEVGLKEKIDVDPIKELLKNTLRPGPLYLEVRDESSREGFQVEYDDVSTKEELERQVIIELLKQGEYSSHAKELHTLIKEIKEAVVKREGLDSFDDRVRGIAKELVTPAPVESSPCTEEGEDKEHAINQANNEGFTHS